MTFQRCSDTGFFHRLFLKEEKDAPRHSIGTVCPRCALDLYVHSEAGTKEGLQLAAQTAALAAQKNKPTARTPVVAPRMDPLTARYL